MLHWVFLSEANIPVSLKRKGFEPVVFAKMSLNSLVDGSLHWKEIENFTEMYLMMLLKLSENKKHDKTQQFK